MRCLVYTLVRDIALFADYFQRTFQAAVQAETEDRCLHNCGRFWRKSRPTIRFTRQSVP